MTVPVFIARAREAWERCERRTDVQLSFDALSEQGQEPYAAAGRGATVPAAPGAASTDATVLLGIGRSDRPCSLSVSERGSTV